MKYVLCIPIIVFVLADLAGIKDIMMIPNAQDSGLSCWQVFFSSMGLLACIKKLEAITNV